MCLGVLSDIAIMTHFIIIIPLYLWADSEVDSSTCDALMGF